MTSICESVEFLLSNVIPYEFRTTVVRELHDKADFESIGKWIAGCQAYFLQAYRDSPDVIHPGFTSYTKTELEQFQKILLRTIPSVSIRGID